MTATLAACLLCSALALAEPDATPTPRPRPTEPAPVLAPVTDVERIEAMHAEQMRILGEINRRVGALADRLGVDLPDDVVMPRSTAER